MNHLTIDRTGSGTKPPRARLLVADDDPFVRELHSLVLSADGYEVARATDGADALFKLAAQEFDLVLSDKDMPGLDGASMVLAMRSSGIRIPVIIISGSLAQKPLPPEIAREIYAAIPKPARSAEWLSAVARALRPAPPRECLEHPAGAHRLAA